MGNLSKGYKENKELDHELVEQDYELFVDFSDLYFVVAVIINLGVGIFLGIYLSNMAFKIVFYCVALMAVFAFVLRILLRKKDMFLVGAILIILLLLNPFVIFSIATKSITKEKEIEEKKNESFMKEILTKVNQAREEYKNGNITEESFNEALLEVKTKIQEYSSKIENSIRNLNEEYSNHMISNEDYKAKMAFLESEKNLIRSNANLNNTIKKMDEMDQATLKREIETLKEKLINLETRYHSGFLNEEDYTSSKAQIKEEIESLTKKLNTM